MNRNLIRALLYAWERPEFRAGLQHLIDLDQVTALLAALSTEDRDHEQERRALDLLRSALDSPEIRRAVLLLVESDDIRLQLAAAVAEGLPDRPALAIAIASALNDPRVRAQLHDALETPQVRALLLRAAEDGAQHRRWSLARQLLALLARHRTARRLAWSLHRHGLLRALRE
ncbi:hypothetical protein [Catellatospora citrea]|uniref:Uncharacterized protein n=1 Tax=Catellatospora citrea TaxID=53366 RepID=A0A8J3NZ18_9ACTN|nr:hypothetical protein [Catellatospora citrea]RKE06072.1 hypothetical protein C8E86_0890 [Catellatospora citrea]GIF97738.1 hypothetical protein Cci01nite_28320 [Catellatospora citrea]